MQALEGNISTFFFKFGLGKDFLTMTQNPEAIKKIDKFDYIKQFLKVVWPKRP